MAKKSEEIKEKEEKINTGDCVASQVKCENICENENYLELAQRIQADFDNYRKRSADIIKVARLEGIIDAFLKFLPAIDSIQKAKEMIAENSVRAGVELIEKELLASIKSLGIEKINAKGQFDAKLHNVIAVQNDNSLEDGVIVDVYQAGYKIKEKIIRYAQVVVNKIKED